MGICHSGADDRNHIRFRILLHRTGRSRQGDIYRAMAAHDADVADVPEFKKTKVKNEESGLTYTFRFGIRDIFCFFIYFIKGNMESGKR